MKNYWRFFCTIVCLLLLLILWQILHNPPRAIMLLAGLLLFYFSKRRQSGVKRLTKIIGCLLIGLSLVNTASFWILLIFLVLFIGLKGIEITGLSPFSNNFFGKKKLIIVETKEPEERANSKKKTKWFGDERIGTSVFEWDDINLSLFAGDTIIDLGNTLLPKRDNIIVVRKLLGNTKVLIPNGIAVNIQHQALMGSVRFDSQEIELKNEQVTLYSDDYDQNTRRIKLISSVILGDIEVIRI